MLDRGSIDGGRCGGRVVVPACEGSKTKNFMGQGREALGGGGEAEGVEEARSRLVPPMWIPPIVLPSRSAKETLHQPDNPYAPVGSLMSGLFRHSCTHFIPLNELYRLSTCTSICDHFPSICARIWHSGRFQCWGSQADLRIASSASSSLGQFLHRRNHGLHRVFGYHYEDTRLRKHWRQLSLLV
jgi:hypothetical protein